MPIHGICIYSCCSLPAQLTGHLCGYKWMTCAPERITFSVSPLSCDVDQMYRPQSIAQILYARALGENAEGPIGAQGWVGCGEIIGDIGG